jgi:hypothetical protein
MDRRIEAEIKDLRGIGERARKAIARMEEQRRRIDEIGTRKASK